MKEEGPYLETLIRRLTECPADFLGDPTPAPAKSSPSRADTPLKGTSSVAGKSREIRVDAVVFDLLLDLDGVPLPISDLSTFKLAPNADKNKMNRLRLILIACWILHDPWFLQEARIPRSEGSFSRKVYTFLSAALDQLATLVPAQQCLTDIDRREELIRVCLKELGYRPRGESLTQAQDRLVSLDSVERTRLIREARASEERARQIREAMAKKAAEEAAASYGRE